MGKIIKTTMWPSLVFLPALFLSMSLSACTVERMSKSNEKAQTYAIDAHNFTAINNISPCDVHFTQSSAYSVRLKVREIDRKNYQIEVKDGTLYITYKNRRKELNDNRKNDDRWSFVTGHYDDEAEIWISAPRLNSLSITGSGDFESKGSIKGDRLQISSTGGNDIELGNVQLADVLVYNRAGSGDFEAASIQAKSVKLTITGSGDAEVSRIKAEDVVGEVCGSGEVSTKGVKAQRGTFSVEGSGEISLELSDLSTVALSVKGSGSIDALLRNCGDASAEVFGSGNIELEGNVSRLRKQIDGSGSLVTSELRIGRR